MSDPRTGGVAQEPRKTKKNGVKNLKGAQATPEFPFLDGKTSVCDNDEKEN